MDPNDHNNLDPADRMVAHNNPGVILEPETRIEPQPPAPAAAPAPAPATREDLAALTDQFRRSNDRVAQILEERQMAPPPAPKAPEPDPLEALLKDADPAVRAIAEQNRELRAKMEEVETRQHNAQLAQQETELRSKFRVNDSEMDEIYRRWGINAEKDPKSWAELSLLEATMRIVGFDALAQRRIKDGEPALGRETPVPATPRPPARMLTEPAMGSQDNRPPVRPDRTWSTEESVNYGWDQIGRGRR